LKLGGNINYTNSDNSSPNSGSVAGAAFNTSGLGRIAMVQAPNVPAFLPNGDYNVSGSAIGKGANVLAPNYPNPLPIIDLDKNTSETNRFFSNINTELKLLEGLTFNNNFTWDLRNTTNQQFWNPINGDGNSYNGYAYNNSAKNNNWLIFNTLVYTKSFGEHNLTVLGGHEAQGTRLENWGAVRYNLTDSYLINSKAIISPMMQVEMALQNLTLTLILLLLTIISPINISSQVISVVMDFLHWQKVKNGGILVEHL
jgi:hypothetical protein